jgi:hypothetical protein
VVRPGGDIGCPCRAACMNRPRLIQDCFAKLGIWFQLLLLAVGQITQSSSGEESGLFDLLKVGLPCLDDVYDPIADKLPGISGVYW